MMSWLGYSFASFQIAAKKWIQTMESSCLSAIVYCIDVDVEVVLLKTWTITKQQYFDRNSVCWYKSTKLIMAQCWCTCQGWRNIPFSYTWGQVYIWQSPHLESGPTNASCPQDHLIFFLRKRQGNNSFSIHVKDIVVTCIQCWHCHHSSWLSFPPWIMMNFRRHLYFRINSKSSKILCLNTLCYTCFSRETEIPFRKHILWHSSSFWFGNFLF